MRRRRFEDEQPALIRGSTVPSAARIEKRNGPNGLPLRSGRIVSVGK